MAMSNRMLKNIILAGLFAVPFIPLIVSSSLFFPFITGKAFVFRLIVEIVFACYLILALRDESVRPRFSWILGALLSFLIFMGLADIFAINSFKAFWSNYERMEGYLTLLHLGAYFIVMGSVLKTQEIWNKLLATSLGASVIMSVYSFLQIAGKITINQGGVRVDGTLGNAAYLGVYMMFHLFIAALLFTRFNKRWQRILIGVVALMNLIVLYYTATRGAILGLLGGAVITFIFLLIKSEKGAVVRKVALGGLLGLMVFVGLFIAFKDSSLVRESPVLSRFASLSFEEIKSQGRYYVWPMAWKGFLERPILGWGQEGFNFVFNKYYVPEMWSQEPWFDRAHNTFLDWLVAGGLLGLLSYLSIIFSLVYYAIKAKEDFLKKEDKAVILGVISAYVFNNLFVFDQISSYILFFTILSYAHAHSSEASTSLWDKISAGCRSIFEKQKWHPIIESFVLIILILILYFVNFVPWRQNKNLLAVLKLNSGGQVGKIEDYKKPLSSYGMWFSESLEHISQTAVALASNPNASQELKQEIFNEVDEAFVRHIEKVPEDARYRIFYGVFLSRFGWYGRALEQLEVAKTLSPKKQSIYFELANNYLLEGKIKEALSNAKTAYDLDPSYGEAKLMYALMATAAGEEALSARLFSGIDQSKLIFDDRYLSVLLSAGQYEKILSLARERIRLEPANLQHRITLTAAYLQMGRRADAVAVLQEMIRLEPSFKEKGEYYISEIRAGRNP